MSRVQGESMIDQETIGRIKKLLATPGNEFNVRISIANDTSGLHFTFDYGGWVYPYDHAKPERKCISGYGQSRTSLLDAVKIAMSREHKIG